MRKASKRNPPMPFSPMCDRCGAMLGVGQEAKHAGYHAELDLVRSSARQWSAVLAAPPDPHPTIHTPHRP